MLSKLFAAIALTVVLAVPALAGPRIDPGAVQVAQTVLPCGPDVFLLDQGWDGGELGYWRVFKVPNGKDAILVLYWKPGNEEKPDEIYLHGKAISMDELLKTAAHPCDLVRRGA